MKDIKEFYILGHPIETEIGLCHFLRVGDYPEYFYDLQMVSMSKQHIIYKYQTVNKKGELTDHINNLSNLNLFDIVLKTPELSQSYIRIFSKVFQDESVLAKITNDNFEYIRSLILKMNGVKEEVINPNPEIQRAIERSKRVKSQANGDRVEFADIITSIVGVNGLSFMDINNFTIYQLYMTYQRIAQIKNYDTSTLFATVSSEKINIESWSKHIDLFAEEKHFFTEQEFKKNTGSVFDK